MSALNQVGFEKPDIPDLVIGPAERFRVAVLVPCRDEAKTVGKVIADFRAVLPGASIYVYDNNSSDESVRIAVEAGACIRHEQLQGKGHVVRRMFRDVEADLYVLVDGDDTYEAAKAPEMIAKALQGPFDLVNGVRMSGAVGDAYSKGHRFGNRLLTGIVRFLFGKRVVDMLSGYKVLSRRFVKSFPSLSSGFEIETELTVHALELAMPIAHVQVGYKGRRKDSSSKIRTYHDGARILRMIFVLFKQERPLLFFSLIALLLATVSVVLAVPVVVTYFEIGKVPRLPTAVLSMGVMLLASLSLTCGLILDTVTRGRRETKMLRYLDIPVSTNNVLQRAELRSNSAV